MEGPGSNRVSSPIARPYSNSDPFSPARPDVRDTRIKVQDPGSTLTRTVSSLRTGAISSSYSSVLSEMEGGIDLRAERTLELDDSIHMSPTSVPRKLLNPTRKGADPGTSIPYMPVRTTQGDEGEGEDGSEGQWKGMDTQCSYGSDSSSSYYSAYSPPSASPPASTSASTSASKYTNSNSLSNSKSKNTNTLSEVDQTTIYTTDPRVSTPVSIGSSLSQKQEDSRFPASINKYSLQVQVADKLKGKDKSKGKDSAGDSYVRQSHSPVPSSASSPYSPLLSPPNLGNTAPKMGERSSYGGV
jgi:hypothetical protein